MEKVKRPDTLALWRSLLYNVMAEHDGKKVHTMVRIKICGITTLEDALMAIGEGADALGFVFAESPRQVTPEAARAIIERLPPFITTVGVFVNESPDRIRTLKDACLFQIVQFHGSESPRDIEPFFPFSIKAFRMKDRGTLASMDDYRAGAFLLDAWDPSRAGGTGKTFDWEWAREAGNRGRRIILSGGLSADNLAAAIDAAGPYAVDVSSGVEAAPGRKDREKVRAFIAAAGKHRPHAGGA